MQKVEQERARARARNSVYYYLTWREHVSRVVRAAKFRLGGNRSSNCSSRKESTTCREFLSRLLPSPHPKVPVRFGVFVLARRSPLRREKRN